MRYYAVLGAENAPHVIAEFARRSEAQEFDDFDSYSEAELAVSAIRWPAVMVVCHPRHRR